MANGGNRPIAPTRKLIATVLGTVATFIVLFGLGMPSWAIVALGVALLVLAIALATVRGSGRAWVVGLGHVHSVSEPPTQYTFGRCELQLVIDAPGLPPRSKKIIEPRVAVAKWPSLGQMLPVRVALNDHRHVRVLWDEVPTQAEIAAALAGLPPEYADAEPAEEVLIAQNAPPWAHRAPEDDFRDDFPPASDPLLDDVTGLPDDREPVVVHQRPGGPVVLEGQLVEATGDGPMVVEPTTGGPLPRRATTPVQRPPAEERLDRVDPVDVPLDEPAAEAVPTPEELDEAIFGPAGDDPAKVANPISGVGITLLVTDLDRSLDFYRDLGFAELDRGAGNAVLASGATRLVLRQVTGAVPISRRLVHVNLEVDDIQAAYERLRGAGVRFTYAPRVVNRGTKLEVWAAAFRDPDGHGVALTQWRTLADA